MEHLTQYQLHSNCKLEMPEGLRELMADISREVLRAQPENLYQFISDYLSALLVTREHLVIGARICADAGGFCHPTLVEELKNIGLGDEDAQNAAEIIAEYFERDLVKEENLINKLVENTAIKAYQLFAVQSAIQKAYMRRREQEEVKDEESSDKVDDITRAVDHTLKLYEKTNPTEQEYIAMATNIQAAYKGYGVRRHKSKSSHTSSNSNVVVETRDAEVDDLDKDQPDKKVKEPANQYLRTLSSHSLAGSLLELPKYKPYCTFEDNGIIEEIENATFDYTSNNSDGSHAKVIFINPNSIIYEETKEGMIKSEHHVTIEDEAVFADDESNGSVDDEAKLAAHDNDGEEEDQITVHDNDGDDNTEIAADDNDGDDLAERADHDNDGDDVTEMAVHNNYGIEEAEMAAHDNDVDDLAEMTAHNNVGDNEAEMSFHDNDGDDVAEIAAQDNNSNDDSEMTAHRSVGDDDSKMIDYDNNSDGDAETIAHDNYSDYEAEMADHDNDSDDGAEMSDHDNDENENIENKDKNTDVFLKETHSSFLV